MNIDPQKTVFIIDGSSFLYRAYYSLRPLHTSQGFAVQAVYGFCRMIKKLIDMFDVHYIVIVWDSKGKTERHAIYEPYKATRQAPPSDIFDQKEYIIRFADLIGIKQIAISGIEADDIMYSIASDITTSGDRAVMVSSDKDMGQALQEGIYQYDPVKNEFIDADVFTKQFGFEPAKLPFYYALLGDASDNIPGVAGIGKKTATELVTQHESLEHLYEHLGNLKPRIQTLLSEQKENAFLSYRLFLLRYQETEKTKDVYLFERENYKNAAPLFKELEFLSLLKDITQEVVVLRSFPSTQTIEAKVVYWQQQTKCIMNEQELVDLCDALKKHGSFAIDTETSGGHPLATDLVGISVSYNAKEAYYIPCGHTAVMHELSGAIVIEKTKPIFENPDIKKYMHNAKYDLLVLKNQGINVRGLAIDTMIAASLVRTEGQKIGLKMLSQHHFNESMLNFSEVVVNKDSNFAQVSLDLATAYAGADALQTYKLRDVMHQELTKEDLLSVYNDIEHPLIEVLCAMEGEGICLDVSILQELSKTVGDELAHIEHEIAILANIVPGSINLNSPKQVENLLFVELKLPPKKKSAKRTGYSTDQEVLNILASLHPVPKLLIKYRELAKLKSTYIDALPASVNSKTGRIHTSFNQASVATGRLASSDPNMQNIPASGFGIEIRRAFKPKEGHLFIAADYSQIELRVLAYLAQEEKLIHAFTHGHDIHTQTAAGLFEVEPQNVTHEQRQLGKRINFSILYGQTPFGLSKELGIPMAQAKKYIERYFNQYPAVQKWMDEVVAFTQEHGYVKTHWGRRRPIPNIYERNKTLYEEARRVAINTVAQGTAADIVKLGMIELHAQIQTLHLDAALVLQIHDELLITAARDVAEQTSDLTKKILEGITPSWNVPLEVSIRTGSSWKDVSK